MKNIENQIKLLEGRITKTRFILGVLKIGLLGIVLSSLYHLQYTFSTVEGGEGSLVGWILAITVDAIFVTIVYGKSEYRKLKERSILLNISLAFFLLITLYGNTYYAISNYKGIYHLTLSDILDIDSLVIITFLLTSTSLPIMAITLVALNDLFSLKLEKEEQRLADLLDKKESQPGKVKEEKVVKKEEPEKEVLEPKILESMDLEVKKK